MIIGAAGGAIAAAGISAAASIGTQMMAGDAQSSAAGQAQAANEKLTQEQIALAGQARDRSNAYQQPYYNAGLAGQNKLGYLLGVTNKEVTPTDTSYNAFRATVTSQQAQLQGQIQALGKKPKGGKALKAWQQQRTKLQQQSKTLQGKLQGGQTNASFQTWKERQPGSITTEKPIDSTYGSLMQDYQEQYKPKEFNFQADPGYQFRLEEGNKALANKLAGAGMYNSGAAVKEALRVNQGLADQTYNDAFNRFQQDRSFDYGSYQDRINRFNENRGFKVGALTNFASQGQQAAGQMSQNENIYGGNVTGAKAQQNQSTQSNINALGNTRAAGYMGAGNAISGLADNYIAYNARQQGANANTPAVSTKQMKRPKAALPNAMARPKAKVGAVR